MQPIIRQENGKTNMLHTTLKTRGSRCFFLPAHFHKEWLVADSPARGIDDDAHQTACNDTGYWQSDNPAHVDPSNHAPIDCSPGAVAQPNADCRARDTLRGRDGELQPSRHGNCDSTAQLH